MSTSSTDDTVIRDVVVWRRKKESFVALAVSTLAWCLLQLYQFNLLTLVSWLGMLALASLFIWGNMLRLLGKEAAELSRWEIGEESAARLAQAVRAWSEQGLNLVLRVGCDSDVFTFGLTIAALYSLSHIGRYFDLLTLLYVAILTGMTVTPIYMRYQHTIRSLKQKMITAYDQTFNHKLFKKLNSLVTKTPTSTQTKDKKAD